MPDLLTKNSPIITPIKLIEILSFKLDIIVLYELGITNLNNIWYLFAPKDFNNLIFLSSVLIKPLYIVIMLIIKFIG